MKRIIKLLLLMVLLVALVILTGCGNSNENGDGKLNSKESYEYLFDTDIPTPETVLGYDKPIVKLDQWKENSYYSAQYADSSMDGYSSKVSESDLQKYADVITKAGYEKLENNIYSKEDFKITLALENNVFSITIEK